MPFPIPSARIVQLASVRPLENLLGKNGCCVRGRILAFEFQTPYTAVWAALFDLIPKDTFPDFQIPSR